MHFFCRHRFWSNHHSFCKCTPWYLIVIDCVHCSTARIKIISCLARMHVFWPVIENRQLFFFSNILRRLLHFWHELTSCYRPRTSAFSYAFEHLQTFGFELLLGKYTLYMGNRKHFIPCGQNDLCSSRKETLCLLCRFVCFESILCVL